jgi:hypothetical protein
MPGRGGDMLPRPLLEARADIGFVTVQSYVVEEDDGIRWELVLWDWGANNNKAK